MKRKLTSIIDFGGSNKIDPTPGGIPFVFLIAIVFPMLMLIVIAAYWYLS